MKNTAKVFGITAVITAIVFSIVLILSACEKGKNDQWKTFSNISEFKTALSALSKKTYNTVGSPYKVKLNLNNNDMTELKQILLDTNKYIYLDLSGGAITSIKNYAFEDCNKLVGIIMPNGIISIGEGTFIGCENLTDVTIPNSVIKIGIRAFRDCISLVSVTIPDSVINIGGEAFTGCKNLSKLNVDSDNIVYLTENGVLYNKDKTILYVYSARKKERSFSIPNTVKNIEGYAFFLERICLWHPLRDNHQVRQPEIVHRGFPVLTIVLLR
jgi:hypothetical protein